MSDNSTKLLRQLLSASSMDEIDHWISKYPPEEKQSAVMSALRIAQEELGYLMPEVMDAVANYLEIPPIAVYEVASFYTMYECKPIGRNLINVCTNISCKLSGSAEIVKHLKKKLKIELNETTADGTYTLRAVECLGACVNAPMMQINKTYYENLTNEKVDKLLEFYDEK